MIQLVFDIIANIFIYDLVSIILSMMYIREYSQRSRWFILHAFINSNIQFYAYNDLVSCLANPHECTEKPFNDYSWRCFLYCSLLHIYHILLFKLSRDDILHHSIMLGICGPLSLYNPCISISSSLFFLSGLPGLIDYLLLWNIRTRNNIMSEKTRCRIAILTNLLIRSPGCIILAYINILNFSWINMFQSMILFWNSQYYLNTSYKNYYKQKNLIAQRML
jgi:hypothetical protein